MGLDWVLLSSSIFFEWVCWVLNGFCWVQTYFLNGFAGDLLVQTYFLNGFVGYGSDGFEWV